MTNLADILNPFALTGRLLARFWPQLLLIGAAGYILRDLLLQAAVGTGLRHPLGGMVILSLVVLSRLVVVVMMFVALRPGLPALDALRQKPTVPGPSNARRAVNDHMLAITAAAILPFFAYYAAWGFLGDTVREYSRMALSNVAFGEKAHFLDLSSSQGLLLSIAACWLVRWLAKHMNKRARSPYWRLLIVAADASWIFIGLYGLSVWKDAFISWLGAGPLLGELSISMGSLLISAAQAAETFTPVELQRPDLTTQAQNLFFYALLPIVWLVMAAIINGYELSSANQPVAPMNSRAKTWRKWIGDFVNHFISDYRSRYGPVWTCLKLTLGSGVASLLVFIVAYRTIGWMGAWLWFGATRLLNAPDLDTWQVAFRYRQRLHRQP
ncbi:hypothetical protein PYH37_001588 [Sinorhizobium numidicum]|uniref:DUF418 domain-containing protein n=1 Tax=Sinorhizobium numidicum TaxID=680248 RepID=A0ABY8CNI3_9HYPH|nr:hypothetical protein [Sinorhizobium numidicum]WEX74199.1 hypothetical protein PYH37_001588 [Sinorhizobium numidicum]WEX80184.1 hypothetical protein PYH38_001589 [Sinorhizobium numidicum]